MVGLPLLAVVVGVAAAILAWRERPEPGAVPLTVMLAGQAWWAGFFVLEVTATTPAGKFLWYDVQWLGVVVIPVAWLVFALEYTGRDELLTRRLLAGLAIVPLITVLLAATGDPLDLLIVDRWVEPTPGGDFVATNAGPWYYVAAGYTYLLGLFGSIPLLQLVRHNATTFRGQGVALLVGTLVPWASSVLYLSGASPITGLDLTPIAFALAGVAYLGALTRFRLLYTNPSPMRHARSHVFDRMAAGVVVVDNNGSVVDCNQSAANALGIDPETAVGRPASAVVPSYDQVPETGSPDEPIAVRGPDGHRSFDVTASRINDVHGRPVGRALIFHDVGEYIRQRQRLEVLNRVLRHNIRTETNLIHGYADLAGDEDTPRAATVIKESAMRIHNLGERTRMIADLFDGERERAAPAPLDTLLERAVERARLHHPEATVIADDAPDEVHVSEVVDVVLDNLLSNAVEHDPDPDPTVRILVAEPDDGWIRITVRDEGPGISDYEWAIVERGSETPLEHGSGLGLWLVRWGVDIAGGSVEREEGETGTSIHVDLPVREPEGEEREDSGGKGEDDEVGEEAGEAGPDGPSGGNATDDKAT